MEIDIRDLVEGVFVLDRQKRLIKIHHFHGQGVAVGFTMLGEKSVNDVDNLSPVPISTNWLTNLGGRNISAVKENVTFGFVPEADGPMPPDVIHVQYQDNTWYLIHHSTPLCVLSGIHHLQTLVWQLERVWLILPQ